MSKSFVVYYRVSTKRQGESGLGLAAQREILQQHLTAKDSVLGEFTEVETGKKADRPQLQAAIELAKSTGSTLIVAKLDRLARNVAFTSTLMASGVDFAACDLPQANRFTIHVMAAVAEEEARATSERTRNALTAARRRGVKLGSAREGHWDGIEHKRGWRGSKRAAELKASRFRRSYGEALPVARALRAKGETLVGIAKALNDGGMTTPRDAQFTACTVHRILRQAAGERSPADA